MTYQLIYDKKALKELNKLENEIKFRIVRKLKESKENPFRFFERLEGRIDFKLRVGDYRVIANIENEKIQVTDVGHRKNIYSE